MAAEPTPPGPSIPAGLMVIGSEMAGFTVVGVLLDLYVFGTMPWLTVGLTLLGFTAAFLHLLRMVKARAGGKGR